MARRSQRPGHPLVPGGPPVSGHGNLRIALSDLPFFAFWLLGSSPSEKLSVVSVLSWLEIRLRVGSEAKGGSFLKNGFVEILCCCTWMFLFLVLWVLFIFDWIELGLFGFMGFLILTESGSAIWFVNCDCTDWKTSFWCGILVYMLTREIWVETITKMWSFFFFSVVCGIGILVCLVRFISLLIYVQG